MRKIFLSVASMIFTGFLMKSYKKLHDKPETKEEIYRRMKAEYDAHRQDEFFRKNPPGSRISECLERISTPCNGAIGAKQKMRDALRPSNDQCDAMAMVPGRFS